jgi:hypothetical protein
MTRWWTASSNTCSNLPHACDCNDLTRNSKATQAVPSGHYHPHFFIRRTVTSGVGHQRSPTVPVPHTFARFSRAPFRSTRSRVSHNPCPGHADNGPTRPGTDAGGAVGLRSSSARLTASAICERWRRRSLDPWTRLIAVLVMTTAMDRVLAPIRYRHVYEAPSGGCAVSGTDSVNLRRGSRLSNARGVVGLDRRYHRN